MSWSWWTLLGWRVRCNISSSLCSPFSSAQTFHKLAPSCSDEGNSRTGRNFFHSAKLCFKVSVSSAAGAATFPEAQRIVSWVFGHRCPIFPCAFHRCAARHELGTTLPINRGSNFARFSHGIPPLPFDCQQPGTRGIRSGWMGWVSAFWGREKWRPGWLPGSQAVAPLAASPPSPGWPSWRRVGRLAGAGTCCLEASSAAGSAASELLVMVGGWQPAEQKFPRTLVDRRTAADPGHPTYATGLQTFYNRHQPTLLLFARSYIKVYTLFQFSWVGERFEKSL